MPKVPPIVPIEFSSESRPLDVQSPLHRYSSFTVLSGRPGSGKSTALLNLITRRPYYAGRYDTVYVISPSFNSVTGDDMFAGIPDSQKFKELNTEVLDTIVENIRQFHQGEHVLIIMDDCINDLARSTTNTALQRLCFNRRHLCSQDPDAPKGGFCSIICTTQVLNRLPLQLRKMASSVWLYPTKSPKERACISEELVPCSKSAFEDILKKAWTSQHSPLICDCDNGTYWRVGASGFERIISGDEWVDESTSQAFNSGRNPIEAAKFEVLQNYFDKK